MSMISTEYVPPRKGKLAQAVPLPPLPDVERQRLADLLRQLREAAERPPADPMMLTEDAHLGWARRFAELVKENTRMVAEYEAPGGHVRHAGSARLPPEAARGSGTRPGRSPTVRRLAPRPLPRCPVCSHPLPVAARFRQFPADQTILAEKVYGCRFCPPAGR